MLNIGCIAVAVRGAAAGECVSNEADRPGLPPPVCPSTSRQGSSDVPGQPSVAKHPVRWISCFRRSRLGRSSGKSRFKSNNLNTKKQHGDDMKGAIILTAPRSGSSWLGSLTNGTKMLGVSREWFAQFGPLGKTQAANGEELIRMVIEQSSTSNGFFCVKLFPWHVHRFSDLYKYDLINYFIRNHDVLFVKLTRHDRLRQAISLARALQTDQWNVHDKSKRDPEYSFETICQCYFVIERSDRFWESYAHLRSLQLVSFEYEKLVPYPIPYLDVIAKHADVEYGEIPPSNSSVQRDGMTEEWIERFCCELPEKNIIEYSALNKPHRRTLANFMRLAGLKPRGGWEHMYRPVIGNSA